MKAVVIFYPHISEFGGIERNILALAEEICAHSQKAILLCYYDKINLAQYGNETIEVQYLRDHWNPVLKAKSLRAWLEINGDIIHKTVFFFGAKAGFYGAIANLKGFALHYTDPPSLIEDEKSNSIKELFLLPRRIWSKNTIAKGVRHAGLCITMTKWNAEELERLYKRQFMVVYQGGVPGSQTPRTVKSIRQKNLRLFSICRITPSKNLYWILDIAKHLLSNYPFKQDLKNLKVVIAGTGPELEHLKQHAQNSGLQDHVEFPGFLSANELEQQFALADFFLVPGRQGYGLPVLEALYRHVPVVLNKESRISEFLENNSWVKVSENCSASFTEAFVSHLINASQSYPQPDELSDLPTEKGWAQKIGKVCGWW